MSSVRRQYPFDLIESKWQAHWDAEQTFRAWNPGEAVPAGHPFGIRHGLSGQVAATQLPEKFYILDMFPYPSGAGLHVGHPEGYTATDVLARYRRAQGFNVLHPMGWDAFGLPAEQYAVKTGQHPRVTTEANIANFTRQIKSLGFSYDWTRELATTDPDYFKWTQWIFLKLYNSWFNPETSKAEPIETLKYPAELERAAANVGQGSRLSQTSNENGNRRDACPTEMESARRAYRDSKRLAYVSEAPVNWCPELGTVLANEEVIDGKSEVGGFPVIRKPMRQWMLRITAYAERMLADLDTIDWSDSLKEMQRNWIGRSEGAEVDFEIADCGLRIADSEKRIRVFTTRPDTLFGATYMVLSPEHKLVDQITPVSWPNEVPVAWIQGASAPQINSVKDGSSVNAKAAHFGAEVVDLTRLQIRNEALAKVPQQVARKYKVIPVEVGHSSLTIALSDPSDIATVDALSHLLKTDLTVVVAAQGDIEAAVNRYYPPSPQDIIASYRAYAAGKSDLERTELAKEKTGVFTGAYAINPVNGEKIPIWIADYVLASYGTGAIMAVPAHDERDFEFARKFDLPIRVVVQPPDGKDPLGWTEDGVAINSSPINGLTTKAAKREIINYLVERGLGWKTINYKLRDWLFSRQRYWGEPFPIIWKKDAAGNLYHEALPESSLPLLPPSLEDYKPTTDGQPPLARAKDWLNLPDGSVRETNTMPQWAGSCWYYLRYLDTKNSERGWNASVEKYWMGSNVPRVPATPGAMAAAIRSLVREALQSGNVRHRIFAGRVDSRTAAQIEQATGLKLQGYYHALDTYGVRHAFHEHGSAETELPRGQRPITTEDFLLVPQVIAAPDAVEHAGKTSTGLEVIRLIKRINGFLVLVEEVLASKDYLALKTLYVRPLQEGEMRPAKDAAIGASLGTSGNDRADGNVADAPEGVKTPALGVDLYVGGTEHAVLHLLYARFWHKVLFDLGHVSTAEPFFKLVNQGLILGADGQKMSKSRGNVVNPDDILAEYGADAFRLYEMFMGPLQDTKPWNTQGVAGVYKFLGRVWRLFVDEQSETEFEQAETTAGAEKTAGLLSLIKLNAALQDAPPTAVQLKTLHACIKKVTEDLDGMRFNTAISAMMVFVNDAITWPTRPVSVMRTFLQLLAPFAPHLAEELWAKLATCNLQPATSLTYAPWPKHDPALLVENEIEIPVQVNGKLRDVIRVSVNADHATIEAAARNAEKVKPFLEGKIVKKVIIVPKKLVNLVVG